MKRLTILSILAVSVLSLSSCDRTARYQKKFDKYFEKNLKVCVDTMTKNGGVNKADASNYCSCSLRKAFELNPETVNMNGDEFSLFYAENMDKFEDCAKVLLEQYMEISSED